MLILEKVINMSKTFAFILLLLIVSNISAQDSLIFITRVDDIMNRNTSILPRSIVPFENLANARIAKITRVVIPHRLIENKNQNVVLKQELINSIQNGHEVSQHGYNHYQNIFYLKPYNSIKL